MLRKFWDNYKNSLKKEMLVHILVIIGLIGILCIVLSSCLESKPEQNTPETESESQSAEAYRQSLQNELAEMLSQIAGVGKTQVLVTLESSEAYHYAQEDDSRYVTVGGSQKEALIESVSVPSVTGVIIACEGGSASSVQETVYKTVSVACGLRMSQIYVTKLDTSADY